ncbi:hypothetical protein G6F65_020768 [Rhizopus arrhizus]|nr:hypothetical protein G6F65_020768 [Rhizopus arrhizus]
MGGLIVAAGWRGARMPELRQWGGSPDAVRPDAAVFAVGSCDRAQRVTRPRVRQRRVQRDAGGGQGGQRKACADFDCVGRRQAASQGADRQAGRDRCHDGIAAAYEDLVPCDLVPIQGLDCRVADLAAGHQGSQPERCAGAPFKARGGEPAEMFRPEVFAVAAVILLADDHGFQVAIVKRVQQRV